MNSVFYQEESQRLKKRNYAYGSSIIIGWILTAIMSLGIYGNPGKTLTLVPCMFMHTWGAVIVISTLYDDLYTITELGQKHPRLVKYAFVPVPKKDLYLACIMLMGKYLMIYHFGFAALYLGFGILLEAKLQFPSLLLEELVLLLLNALVLLVYTLIGIKKNGGLK